MWDEAELGRMVDEVGAAALVAAVDVAAGRARGAGWLDEGRPLHEVLHGLAAAGVTQILLTAISRDGMMTGPDLGLLERAVATGMRVIASGGVGSLADLENVVSVGAAGAIVGRAIYEGRFTVEAALAAVG